MSTPEIQTQPGFLQREGRRWWGWSAIISQIASAQLLVLLINAVTGFLIVRMLDKQQYSWFTIASALAAVLSWLGDSGISTGLLSQGGKIWNDRGEFSRLSATALRLRHVLLVAAFVITGPATVWVLMANGAHLLSAAALTGAVLLGGWFSAESAILGLGPSLQSRFRILQIFEVLGAGLRCVGSVAMLLLKAPALALILAASLAQWAQLRYLRSRVAPTLDAGATPSAEHRAALLSSVRSLWFPAMYSAFQGQFGAFLLGIFSTSSSVASFGALTRFGALFSIPAAIIGTAVAPAFAKSSTPRALALHVARSVCAIVIFCASLIALAYCFPSAFLWLIGDKYSNLSSELVLYLLALSLNTIATLGWVLLSSRGWVVHTWLTPVLTMLLQAILLTMLNITTVSGNLWLMIWSQFPALGMTAVLAWRGFSTWSAEAAAESPSHT